MALAAVWGLTGNVIWPKLGGVLVLLTFILASFGAWRDGITRRALTARITGVRVETHFVYVDVTLTNLSTNVRGVLQHWSLTTTGGDGVLRLHGSIDGEIRPLQPEEQFNVSLIFRNDVGLSPLGAFSFDLSGSDIHGHRIGAVFPDVSMHRPIGSGTG